MKKYIELLTRKILLERISDTFYIKVLIILAF